MSGELKVFGGRAHPELTEKICAYLNLAPGKVTLYNFSDGETFFQIRENVRGSDVYVVQPTCAPVNDNLMELLIMLDAFKRSSASRVTAVMRAAEERRKASIMISISTRCSSTGADVGCTRKMSVPRMFSSI